MVARLTTTDGTVTLALSRFERIEGFHGDITVAAASVTEIRASKDLWSELRGVRAPGTGFPVSSPSAPAGDRSGRTSPLSTDGGRAWSSNFR